MGRGQTRPEPGATISFDARINAGRVLVAVLIPALVLASVTVGRAALLANRPATSMTGAARDMTPAELTAAAADALELATAADGTGVSFDVVQQATLVERAGGATIDDPDPIDPGVPAATGSQIIGSYLERGVLSPDGFHSEIRRGPDDPRAPPDWDAASMELAALVRDGHTFRNDGVGWYTTDRPPGIGLDPATAALLPRFVRGLVDLRDTTDPQPSPSPSSEPGGAKADPFADLALTRRLEGATRVADIPGVIAVDLADATELRGPADLAFDDAGRLIGLRILARNTHLDRYDLLVETVITFAYPPSVPDLPRPEPTWKPPAAPADGE